MIGSKWEGIDELINALKKCEIDDFKIEGKERKLIIGNKDDFDRYLKEFPDAKPMEESSSDPYAPYGHNHWAFFKYKAWCVDGNIVKRK